MPLPLGKHSSSCSRAEKKSAARPYMQRLSLSSVASNKDDEDDNDTKASRRSSRELQRRLSSRHLQSRFSAQETSKENDVSNILDGKENDAPKQLDKPRSPSRHKAEESTAPNQRKGVLSPGPTPYCQVVKERGGNMSPRITRSSAKKKAAKELEEKRTAFFAEESEEKESPRPRTKSNSSSRARRTGSSAQKQQNEEKKRFRAIALDFSPPNKAENERLEKEREEKRARRIEIARKSGQLAEFSPPRHGPPPPSPVHLHEVEGQPKHERTFGDMTLIPNLPPNEANIDHTEEEQQQKRGTQDPPVSTIQQPGLELSPRVALKQDSGELEHNAMNRDSSDLEDDNLSSLSKSPTSVPKMITTAGTYTNERSTIDGDIRLRQIQDSVRKLEKRHEETATERKQTEATLRSCNESLLAANRNGEKKKEELEEKILKLTEQATSERESSLVKTALLEQQLESKKREFDLLVGSFDELRNQLNQQISKLEEEKKCMAGKIDALQSELASLYSEVERNKAQLDASLKQSQSDVEELAADNEQLEFERTRLARELANVTSSKEQLEKQLEEYQDSTNRLESLLAAATSRYDEAVQNLKRQEDNVLQLNAKLCTAEEEKRSLRAQMEAASKTHNDERLSAQAASQEREAAFARASEEIAAKDIKIDELCKQLQEVQDEAEEQLRNLREDMESKIKELDGALRETLVKLDKSKEHNSLLEQKLASEVEASPTESTGESACLTDLESKLIAERERFKSERNELQQKLNAKTAREEELLRQIKEKDLVRKALHGRVMQLMGNIRVFARVRPFLPGEEKEIIDTKHNKGPTVRDSKKRKRLDVPNGTMLFRFPGISEPVSKKKGSSSQSLDLLLTKNMLVVQEPRKDRGGLSERSKRWIFGFDRVFTPEHGQEDVWEATEPLVQSAIDGYNSTIFAYGQTSSGKTHTLLSEDGIVARSVKKIFESKREIESLSSGEEECQVSVELLEVYNEKVYDLLVEGSGPNGSELCLKVTSKEVEGNVVARTSTEKEVMKVFSQAQARRCVKATSSNSNSSRSHLLFTIHFDVAGSNGLTRQGLLHVCDLAGNERLDKSGANDVGGPLLKETKAINKSLSVLSNVIEKLQQGCESIPFRESKLTFLLQNSLRGNSKTLAIVCLCPHPSHSNESLCTLRFAQKVSKVELKAVADFEC